MTTKNIFYTSNSHSEIYPENSRSRFKTQNNESQFKYINAADGFSLAIKSITIENKFNSFNSELGKPHMILVQDNGSRRNTFNYTKVTENCNVDISSGKDFYCFYGLGNSHAEGKNFENRNFTDIKLDCNIYNSLLDHKEILNNFMIHNIYFHETFFSNTRDLIFYLNHVYSNIEFDLAPPGSSSYQDTSELFYENPLGCVELLDKAVLGVDIFLSSDLCELLGFTPSDITKYEYSSIRKLVRAGLREKTHSYGAFMGSEPVFLNADLDIPWTVNNFANMYLDKEKRLLTYFKTNRVRATASNEINFLMNIPSILGLRTNLSFPDVYKNQSYDNIVEFINVKDCEEGVQVFDVKNPSFFKSTPHKVCHAEFELIDVETGKVPNFSIGLPTYIQVLAKNSSTMSKRFNLFLDSSDLVSKKFYPANTPADFRVKLPERLEFNRQWEVTMKSIFFGNDFFNIYKHSCWIELEVAVKDNKIQRGIESAQTHRDIMLIELEDGKFSTIEDLCFHINTLLKKRQKKVRFDVINGKIRIKRQPIKTPLKDYKLKISPYLSNILGLDRTSIKEVEISLTVKKMFSAAYIPNINVLSPSNFVVLCDVVSEAVFGSHPLNILRQVSSNFNESHTFKEFTFYQDEFVDLDIREFSTIQIRIVDATGNLIKSAHSIPTRCQLQFVQNKI